MQGERGSISYRDTGYFSSLILDYLDQDEWLRSFYAHSNDWKGVASSIQSRSQYPVDRQLLVHHLNAQYQMVAHSEEVSASIASLADPNTFTVCTAHQPALFTGNLYFIYKIIHVIKLARALNEQHPGKHFVPVFWMGSEDADLDELGAFYLGKEKIRWETRQTGAVGKMKTKGLETLLRRVEGELGVHPHGKELVELLKRCYLQQPDIQSATFALIHELFAQDGLVVLIPDTGSLKKRMQTVFEDDLFRHIPSEIVGKTLLRLSERYKIQAKPRSINLFYMMDGIRNRLESTSSGDFVVTDTDIRFSPESLLAELRENPGRFSPNVILRGLYQEMILPNILFVGGGGETAYWLELKALFEHYQVPFPVLILRNSFLLIPARASEKMRKLGLTHHDLFLNEQELLNRFARGEHPERLSLSDETAQLEMLYKALQEKAVQADKSLLQHVMALQKKAGSGINALEKKMLRAARKKLTVQQQQLHALKEELFPFNSLQERVENFMPYFARYGMQFLADIYSHSYTVEQQWVMLPLHDDA